MTDWSSHLLGSFEYILKRSPWLRPDSSWWVVFPCNWWQNQLSAIPTRHHWDVGTGWSGGTSTSSQQGDGVGWHYLRHGAVPVILVPTALCWRGLSWANVLRNWRENRDKWLVERWSIHEQSDSGNGLCRFFLGSGRSWLFSLHWDGSYNGKVSARGISQTFYVPGVFRGTALSLVTKYSRTLYKKIHAAITT